MSALANISLDDALPTPVSHVFKPVVHSDKQFVWRDSTAGLTISAAPTIELIQLPSRDKNIRRLRCKVSLPAVETITGSNSQGYTAQPKIAYTTAIICDFVLPLRATEQQIKDAIKFMGGFFNNTQVSEATGQGLFPF